MLDLSQLRCQLESQPFEPLFATVSGAHLYGFESGDSDIDLRGAFRRPLEEIVGLNTSAETVTRNYWVNGIEMDLVCHDIHKFCKLLLKASGEILEQLYSPLVVWDSSCLEELKELGRPCICRRFYHHYRGFLRNQLRFVEREGSTLKELLYGYRVALTGIHLLKTGQMEANLSHLLEFYPQPEVAELILKKRSQQEKSQLEEATRQLHRDRLLLLESQLTAAWEASPLPEGSDNRALHDFVVRLRLQR